MKSLARLAFAATIATSAVAGAAQAAPITFPAPADGTVTLQYGDFTVYSLAMLNYYATGKTSAPSGTDPFYLPSGPGRLSEYIVVATGAGGVNNLAYANTDNPFNTSLPGNQSSFWTGSAAEPNPTFAGDNNGTWDISVETLRGYLGGQNMYFGFNLNEANGGRSLTGNSQDALAWGRITLVDLDTGLDAITFTFNGTNANPLIQSQTLFNAGDGIAWGHIHGQICVKELSPTQSPQLIHVGACTAADVGGKTISQNLGADRTAFALTNDELNSLIQSSGYDIMRIELRLADVNNGYEQLFIFGSGGNTPVSEPAAIGLLGLGALGIAASRRKAR